MAYRNTEEIALQAARKLALRCAGGVTNATPICVTDGDEVLGHGRRWYYTTEGGTEIRHPRAYAKKCYRMIYHHSTFWVSVGWRALPVDVQREIVASVVLGLRRAAREVH